MAGTTKPTSDFDSTQCIQKSYNDNSATLGVDGFLVGQVGRSVVWASIDSVTESYSFYENSQATLLYTLTIVYTDSTKAQIQSVTRTA